MPVNLSIKGVPESLAERLRTRAAANHRSLQGELMAILEAAVEATAAAARTGAAAYLSSDWRTRLSLTRSPGGSGASSVEQVAERIKASYGKGAPRGESSATLVRAMRDERYGTTPAAVQEKSTPAARSRRGG